MSHEAAADPFIPDTPEAISLRQAISIVTAAAEPLEGFPLRKLSRSIVYLYHQLDEEHFGNPYQLLSARNVTCNIPESLVPVQATPQRPADHEAD